MHLLRAVVFLLPVFVFGQTNTTPTQRHLDRATLLESQNQIEEASNAYRDAIEAARSADVPTQIQVLDLACTFYQDAGLGHQAESCLRRLMSVFQARIGPDHLALNRIVNRLACLYIEIGQRAKAERLGLEKWLARLEAEAPLSNDRVDLTGALASLEILRGNPDKSLALNKKAWEVLDGRGDSESVSGLTILNNLSISYSELKRPADAITALESAVRMGEKLNMGTALTMAATHGNLARAYEQMKSYATAERHMAKSLEIVEMRCGKDSVRTAAILASYAPLLRRLGRKPEARAAENRARQIAETLGVSAFTGEHSVDVADLRRR